MFLLPRRALPSVLCLQPGWSRPCGSAGSIVLRADAAWPACGEALTCAGRPLAQGMNSMSDKHFVDTNILVYAHDRSAGVKHQRARTLLEQLWDSGQGVLSMRVLQELCINLCRKDQPCSAGERGPSADPGLHNVGGRHQFSRVCSPGAGYRGTLKNFFLGCTHSSGS